MRLSVLDQSPISEGSTGAAGAAQHARPRAARRRARLPPLLGRRAPRRRRCSPGPSPEALIGPIAAATERDPRRQRRRDAAALQPAQGRRDLQRAGRPVPGPDRPRARPRRGHRPDDDATRCSATAARPRPTTSPSSSPSCWPTSRTAARRPPVRAAGRRCPAARRRRSRGCSAPRRRARSGPAELGLPYAFADFINPDGAAIATDYRARFDPGVAARRAARRGRRRGRSRADTEEEARAAGRVSSRMAMTMLRRGRLIAVPPPETGAALPRAEGEPPTPARPPRRSSARPSRCAPGIEDDRGSSTAPTR